MTERRGFARLFSLTRKRERIPPQTYGGLGRLPRRITGLAAGYERPTGGASIFAAPCLFRFAAISRRPEPLFARRCVFMGMSFSTVRLRLNWLTDGGCGDIVRRRNAPFDRVHIFLFLLRPDAWHGVSVKPWSDHDGMHSGRLTKRQETDNENTQQLEVAERPPPRQSCDPSQGSNLRHQ